MSLTLLDLGHFEHAMAPTHDLTLVSVIEQTCLSPRSNVFQVP